MKSTKYKFFIGLFVGIIIGALIACAVYFLTVGDVAWKEYIENEVIPNAVVVLTSVGMILAVAMPVVKNITCAVGKFDKATKDVSDTVENNGKNEEKIAELADKLERIEKGIANTEEIVRLGFCNNEELVKNGYAKAIAKVGKDEDKYEEEDED